MGGLAFLKPMIRYLTISFLKEDQNLPYSRMVCVIRHRKF